MLLHGDACDDVDVADNNYDAQADVKLPPPVFCTVNLDPLVDAADAEEQRSLRATDRAKAQRIVDELRRFRATHPREKPKAIVFSQHENDLNVCFRSSCVCSVRVAQEALA